MIKRRQRYHPKHHQYRLSLKCSTQYFFRWNATAVITTTTVTIIMMLVAMFVVVQLATHCPVATAVGKNNNKSNNRYYNRNQPVDNRKYPSSSSSTVPPPPPPIRQQQQQQQNGPSGDDNTDDDMLLVEDFPPPLDYPYWDETTESSSRSYDERPIDTPPVPSSFVSKSQQQTPQNRRPFQPPIPQSRRVEDSISTTNGSSQSSLPSIHYAFPQRSNIGADETTANTNKVSSKPSSNRNRNDDTLTTKQQQEHQQIPKFATARHDIVTQYITASVWNRCCVTCSAAMVGCAITAFVGQSLLGQKPSLYILITVATVFAILTWVRNNIYGELIRAISLAILFSFQRSIQIRNQYPAHQYLIGAILGDDDNNNNRRRRRRKPFPPTNNPWTWSNVDNDSNNTDDDDNNIEFQMIPTVVAMALIGSIVGTNIPILPSSFGALFGAAALAYTTTLSSSRGDLCRCMGMRIVAFVREFIIIANTDLHLPNKSAIVASAILDKLLILDRQHSIRQRIGRALSTLIDTVSRIQRDIQQQPASSSSTTTTPMSSSSQQRQRRSSYDDNNINNEYRNDPRSKSNDEIPQYRQQSRQRNYNDQERNTSKQRESNIQSDRSISQQENTSGSGWFSGWTNTRKKDPFLESDVNSNDEIVSRDGDDVYHDDDELIR